MTEDEDEDELRTRRGRFLPVIKTGTQYSETSVKGELFTYDATSFDVTIRIEALAFHRKFDVASGSVQHVITGKTREKFRAIGTEGEYNIFDVELSSQTPCGKVLVKSRYGHDGHSLRTIMRVGLTEASIIELAQSSARIAGTLNMSGVKGRFYQNANSAQRTAALLLPYWKEHAVTGENTENDDIKAEWSFDFSEITLSPKGYSHWLGMLGEGEQSPTTRVTGEVSIYYRNGEHPLRISSKRVRKQLARPAKGYIRYLL